jgi:hypothetical protein
MKRVIAGGRSVGLLSPDPGDLIFIRYISVINSLRSYFRTMRVLLIFKLIRHSSGLKPLGYVIKMSFREIAILLLYMGFGILMFSNLMYFAELRAQSEFTSIIAAFW